MASTSVKLPKLPDIELNYASLPPCHRVKLNLGGGVHCRAKRYVEFITQLRTLCSAGGCVLSDVQEACGMGFPLVEAVIFYESKSVRFLIEKSSIYVIGYWFGEKWCCFNDCRYMIDSNPKLASKSLYKYACTKSLGFRPMYQALCDFYDKYEDTRRRAMEVFFVHIAEAVRFRHVENQVFKGLLCSDQDEPDFEPDPLLCYKWYKDVVNKTEVSEVVGDLLSPKCLFTQPYASVPYLDEVDSFDNLDRLVNNWSRLSRIYVLYCLTGYVDSVGDNSLMQNLRISGIESLKKCLGLIKINLKDLESTFNPEKKSEMKKDLKERFAAGVKALEELKATKVLNLHGLSIR